MTPRVSWNAYFMKIAHDVSERATCDRKHVGAVLVKDRRIVSTGYNGSMPGAQHCDDIGHLMESDHCVRTVHAEVNAIAQAAKNGVSTDGAVLYTNTFPCWPCFKVLVSAGVKGIVFDHKYNMDEKVAAAAKELGIGLHCLEE
jgi:dCMP deaminase